MINEWVILCNFKPTFTAICVLNLYVCTVHQQYQNTFFIMPTDAHNYKIIGMLKTVKIPIIAPTCFGSRRNHHQGAISCSAKTTIMILLCSSLMTWSMSWRDTSLLCKRAVEARAEPDGTRGRREGKWRGNWRMEWVASTLTPPPNVVYPELLKLMRTPRLPAVDWTDAPTDLNGLLLFGERRNLVSARVPSHSARTIPHACTQAGIPPWHWSRH